jgi:oligoribonuclease
MANKPDSKTSSGATPSAEHLAWLDLEMTGLDVNTDVIIQAAVIVTDAKLNTLEEVCVDVWQPESALARMTPFVRDMHEKTGLLSRVRESRVDLQRAEQLLLGAVARHCSFPATLCGNSIWQDRKFVDKYMPALGGFLHYRLLDVSAIKTVAMRWAPDKQFKKPSAAEHDALYDIRNSIAEFRHYTQKLFSF